MCMNIVKNYLIAGGPKKEFKTQFNIPWKTNRFLKET